MTKATSSARTIEHQPTIGDGAKIKALSKAQKAHLNELHETAHELSATLWGAQTGERNVTGQFRAILQGAIDDAREVLSETFRALADHAKPDPMDVAEGQTPTDEQRKAYDRQAMERKADFIKVGNKFRTLMSQAIETLPLGSRPIVSVKLDRDDLSAVVTVLPIGATKEEVSDALEHDKRALTQVLKRMDREAEQLADQQAKIAKLPSPTEAKRKAEAQAKADAENAGSIKASDTGRPLSDFAPLAIMVALLVWTPERMRELSALLEKQAGIKETEAKAKADAEAKAKAKADADAEREETERKAKANAKANGKGTGANAKAKAKADASASAKAKGASGVKPAPVGSGAGAKVAPKAATPAPQGVKRPALDPKAAGVNIKPAKAGKGAPAGAKVDPAPAIAG